MFFECCSVESFCEGINGDFFGVDILKLDVSLVLVIKDGEEFGFEVSRFC